jgi:hypothetical protein
MNPFVVWISKLGCLALLGLGAAQAAWPEVLDLPFDAPRAALILVAIHLSELLWKFKQVRLYKGSLAVSVILTLLFGLLHWKPLADAALGAAVETEDAHG